MMDKLLGKPKPLKKLTYSQFVKRYESTTAVPQNYDYKEDIKSSLLQIDIDNENYILYWNSTKRRPEKHKVAKIFPN